MAESWFDYAAKLGDVPDTVYNAQRQAYFDANVAPKARQGGYNVEATREDFLKKTERPGKASFPKVELTAKKALEAAAKPLATLADAPEVTQALEESTGAARLEAQKQGVGGFGIGASELIGQGIGMAPAFMAVGPMAGALGAGGRALGMGAVMARKAANIAALGSASAAYEGLAAKDGERLEGAATGFLLGAGGAAAFELGLPALGKLIRGKTGVPTHEANALATKIQEGIVDDKTEALAQAAMDRLGPERFQKIVTESFAEMEQAAMASGIPKVPIVKNGAGLEIGETTISGSKSALQAHLKDLEKGILAKTLNEKNVPRGTSKYGFVEQLPGDRVKVFSNPDNPPVFESIGKALKHAESLPDSLGRRQLEADLRDQLRRRGPGSFAQMVKDARQAGWQARMEGGQYIFEQPNPGYRAPRNSSEFLQSSSNQTTRKIFKSLDEAADFVGDTLGEPLTSVNLISDSAVPQAIRKAIADILCSCDLSAPVGEVPSGAPPNLPKGGQIPLGFSRISFMVKPMRAWAAGVARKHEFPQLSTTVNRVLDESERATAFTRTWENRAAGILGKYSPARRGDFDTYLQTPKDLKAWQARELKLKPAEIADIERFNREITDPLFSELNISAPYVEGFAPRMRQTVRDVQSGIQSARNLPDEMKFYSDLARTAEWDPGQRDMLASFRSYLHAGSRRKFLQEPLGELKALIDTPAGEGLAGKAVGGIETPLHRFHEFMWGMPAKSDEIPLAFMGGVKDLMNQAIGAANKGLPASLKLPPVELPPNEMIQKWLKLQYASIVRPMMYARDSINWAITGYPVLGNDVFKGMTASLSKGRGIKNAMAEAKEAGALIDRSHIEQYITNATGQGVSKADKVVDALLESMSWGDNISRTFIFQGAKGKAMRALDEFAATGDPKRFLSKSGLWFADDLVQQAFIREAGGAGKESFPHIATKIAKEMTELTSWRIRKGEQPGMYFYATGRILGQYGTWPLNYVDYLRRLTTRGSGPDRMMAVSRMAVGHGAILSIGQANGVDTGDWVFASPAAFAGGPITSAGLQVPNAMFNWSNARGDIARGDIIRSATTMQIPFGIFGSRVWDAVQNDEPEFWKYLLGFKTMTEADKEKGYHALLPRGI